MTLDTEVRHTVRRIFEHLRKQQPKMRPRKNDRINVDQMIKDHRKRDEYSEK